MNIFNLLSRLNSNRALFVAVGIGFIPLLLSALWLVPRYQTEIATVDDAKRWSIDTAPPRREMIWKTAVPLVLESHHGIRPQIVDNGNTLYFTIRSSSELNETSGLDIVRSRYFKNRWSTPERVAELNSNADDVGPVISANGTVLYMYSNRNGGFGGMDLYEAKLDGVVWSQPVNLGAKINSPADEYDPAVSPKADQLFFSSNRSEILHRQWTSGTLENKSDRWSTTLRSDHSKDTFDLYRANKIADSSVWDHVSPLTSLNSFDHNEGSPFVSSDGAFLLFASDRPTLREEPTNYDLYRVRLDRFDVAPENFGPEINTAANEMEPSSNVSGFELLFSRSDLTKPSQYSLYQSTAEEIYRDARWDHSRWSALVSSLGGIAKTLLNNVWMLLLALAAIGLLTWFLRAVKSHRLAIPGFLLAALLIHFFVVTSSFFVFFQQNIVQKIKSLFNEELVVATQEIASSAAPNAAEQPSFDSVSELTLNNPVSHDELPRQSLETPSVIQPIELDKPVNLSGLALKSNIQPNDALVATVMVDAPPVRTAGKLPRAPVTDDLIHETLLLEPTVAVNATEVEPPKSPPAVMQRQQAPLPAEPFKAVAITPVVSEIKPVTFAIPKGLISESIVSLTINDYSGSLPSASLKRLPASQPSQTPYIAIATNAIRSVEGSAAPALSNSPPKLDVSRQPITLPKIDIATLTITPSIKLPPTSRPEGLQGPMSRIASERIDLETQVPLAASALTTRSTSPSRDYADVSVNLQNLLLRRKLDEATKSIVIKQFGGNDETLTTIRRGLTWIEQHQAKDGHWGLNDFHECCQGHTQCDGRGSSDSDTAGTGLALLPLLGDGNTHQQGPYKDVVARGISWLVKNQKPDGNLFTGGQGLAFMYSHAIATIALCECYNMTGDVSLRGPAQRGIDFIVTAQDPRSGGWRYQPRDQSDTSVVGWQVMALKSGQMADLNVPEKTLKEAKRWLDSVAGSGGQIGQFAYQSGRFTPAMTAEAFLCLEYLGIDRGSDSIVRGTQFLVDNLPQAGRDTSYFWYYGTQAMFHLQGEPWQRWNQAIHPLLMETQKKEGSLAGTWDPHDQWEQSGGRIYATALRILMLEVYYRHLPIYQVID